MENDPLELERTAWVTYSNLHVLYLGGVPLSKDMQQFAPRLFRERTKAPSIYIVPNDEGLDAYRYNHDHMRPGAFVKVDERRQPVPGDRDDALDEDTQLEAAAQRCELWQQACQRAREGPKNDDSTEYIADTGGLSAHGIVPPPPQ